jgi:hypothetical protein
MGGPARHLALGGQAGALLERRFHQLAHGGDSPSSDGGVGECMIIYVVVYMELRWVREKSDGQFMAL